MKKHWKVGDSVRFAHQLASGPTYRITGFAPDGMVTLDGLPGEYAPHLFVEQSPKVTRSDVDEFSRKVRGPK
jgi:hypothetical protein